MLIRTLTPDDAEAFHELRLHGVNECPTAFVSTHEEELAISIETRRERLGADADRAVFGAFEESQLVGVAGVRRDDRQKLAHKAMLWGVYVAPSWRHRGIGRQLVAHALAYAASMRDIRRLYLGVNAANAPAIALYDSMGFKAYGVEEGFMLVDGVLHDEVYMARTIDR